MKQTSNKKPVTCANCTYLTFSDCYGECGKGYRGIVQPDDSCEYGEPKTKQLKHIKSRVVNKLATDMLPLVPLKNIKRGKIFTHCGHNWIVLEHDNAGNTLALSQRIIGQMPFDDNNDNHWVASSLRAYLTTEFLDKLCLGKNIAKSNRTAAFSLGFRNYILDLTTDDGHKDYGQSYDCVFLLTYDLYRKHRDIILPTNDWWWLATAYSTVKGYDSWIRTVNEDGTIDVNTLASNQYGGVRPACYLTSDTTVLCKPTYLASDIAISYDTNK